MMTLRLCDAPEEASGSAGWRWPPPWLRPCGARWGSVGPSAAGRVGARAGPRACPPACPPLTCRGAARNDGGGPRTAARARLRPPGPAGGGARPPRTGPGRRQSSRHLCLSGRSPREVACARRSGVPQEMQHAGDPGGRQPARHRPHHPRGPRRGVRGEPHLCGADGRPG